MRAAILLFSCCALSCSGSRTPDDDAGSNDGGLVTDSGAGTDAGPALADGWHRIPVALPTGGADDVWVHVTTPSGVTDPPIVVYGHGQSSEWWANCVPEGQTFPGLMASNEAFTVMMAAEGYIGVAIHYRSTGDGAPGVGTIRFRDGYLFDASAYLAAALFARQRFGGGRRVAIIGSSFGTFGALWASLDVPELASLRGDLIHETIILQGLTANHVLEASTTLALFGELDPRVQAGGAIRAAYQALRATMAGTMREEVVAADLEPGAPFRTELERTLAPPTIEAARTLLFQARDPAREGCGAAGSAALPAICSMSCALCELAWLEGAACTEPPGTLADAGHWLTSDGLASFGWWDMNPGGDPGADGRANAYLTTLRAHTPAYADHRLLPPRVLHQMADLDSHFDGPSQRLLIDAVRRLGAARVDAPSFPGADCHHGGYRDPALPACGHDSMMAELRAALL